VAIPAVRLNHAVLYVADLERSVVFYDAAFGMRVIAREPRVPAAFLQLPRSGNHHDLGLFQVGTSFGPRRPGIGIYLLAWQVYTIDELAQAQARSPSSASSASPATGHQEPLRHDPEARGGGDAAAREWGEWEHAPTSSRPRRLERWAASARPASCAARAALRTGRGDLSPPT
jgi:catechol 2,3-dioxygenase-like lactoylglutathione lyase family enzyme